MVSDEKVEIGEDVIGWSVPVDFLETLVENCRKSGKEETIVVVREKKSGKMVDSSSHDLYFKGVGPQIAGTWLLSSQIGDIWYDEFPPIPPGP